MASELQVMVYDSIFKSASRALEQYNPCGVRMGADGKAVCNGMRRPSGQPVSGVEPGSLCCTGCEHLTPTGCGADTKPLACRLWLCERVRLNPKNRTVVVRLAALRDLGLAVGLPADAYDHRSFRKSREQILKAI